MTSYQILTGDTHAGYLLDLHESELPAGMSPHPPHKHVHEELLFMRGRRGPSDDQWARDAPRAGFVRFYGFERPARLPEFRYASTKYQAGMLGGD